ncbi:hypothetical protein [Pseudomonas sp. TH31]|uniref:hypothetical protein n=1 Tax=Pseudomonas sp. TH31 TaxID=2796396 RepID=UPI0019147811|nr:hypothetical protein [Pseudomonas sp. TH31]MBK5417713.1 hypothetical protein [Pseudomonas sp. TH31]
MIKQRSWGDCGVVTLINALNDNGMTFFNGPLGYEQMVALLNDRDSGLTIQEVSAVLFFTGFHPTYLPLEGFQAASGIKNAYVIGNSALQYGLKGEKAIFQVKTKSGLLHLVYFDGSFIWDPSVNAPEHPGFEDYEAIVDAVFFKPTASRKKHNREEFIRVLTSKSKLLTWCQGIPRRILLKIHGATDNIVGQEYLVKQKIAEYEAGRKVTGNNTIYSSPVLKDGETIAILDPNEVILPCSHASRTFSL